MLIKSRALTKPATWIVVWTITGLLSCRSEESVKPRIEASLSEKWWCDGKQLLADQYFGEDGSFKQRYEGKIETGKWQLSADNKTITVREVGNNAQGTWTYTIKEVKVDRLVLTFYGADNTFSNCN